MRFYGFRLAKEQHEDKISLVALNVYRYIGFCCTPEMDVSQYNELGFLVKKGDMLIQAMC